ncbi:MAG: chloride channel protein [Crocinitomicaceae bacterium]
MSSLNNSIPLSVSLNPLLESENIKQKKPHNKRRTLIISLLAVGVAVCISFIAKFLVNLIYFITHLAFFGEGGVSHVSPGENHLGLWVILIPTAGGLIAGLMALYGSKAIRGHGIPEAMEQILTNDSKIKPAITYLKPISSAIVIGTGGPFGAEGPIIATGGALGSTFGQLLKISANERKILLAAGATAGMAAIFGSPIAAIFLAIELLLFEFSPRSIIPVALACITGAAGHHFLFSSEPMFAIDTLIEIPSNTALFVYSILGIITGLLSVGVTKVVYWIEDIFEKLPIHWMWWPAIGGLFVGVIGYVSPNTLGVGYENITNILSGNLPIAAVLSLCIFKFVSWAIALGSGTSGGTLAPIMTIGGAVGVLMASVVLTYFPGSGITVSLAALVCMSALFAGASRALLTSIIFALEVTGQFNALLPLLAGCLASYFISFFLMENTIMTEKIARKGVKTPDSYESDILERVTVEHVLKSDRIVLSEENTITEIREWLETEEEFENNYFIITGNTGEYKGILSVSNLMSQHHDQERMIGSLIKRKPISIEMHSSLRQAVEIMAKENIDELPVVSKDQNGNVIGVLTYQDIISAYKMDIEQNEKANANISIKRYGLKILVRGSKIITSVTGRTRS